LFCQGILAVAKILFAKNKTIKKLKIYKYYNFNFVFVCGKTEKAALPYNHSFTTNTEYAY
jgi:hypothetical protein